MAVILALEKLFTDSTATLVGDGTLTPDAIRFGWREVPREQVPAARIVWVPGDPGNRLGDVGSAVKPGRAPERPLATLHELWTCYITAFGISETPGHISAVVQTGPGMGASPSGDPTVAASWLVTITTGGDPDAVRFSWTGATSGTDGVIGAYLGGGVFFDADLTTPGLFQVGTTYAFDTAPAIVVRLDSDPADYHATRLLFDAWYRAVYLATYGRFQILAADWVRPRKEGAWGATIRAVGAIEAMIPDAPTAATGTDTTADIATQLNSLSEDLIAP